MFPPIGITCCIILDICWTFEDAILNWLRLICYQKTRTETEDEEAFRHLRAVSNLLLESIPHAILQTVLLIIYSSKASELGIDIRSVIISLTVSTLNIISNLITIYRESIRHSMSFWDYALVSLQGKFGFIPQLPAIEKGMLSLVDWSRFRFGYESAGMFAETISGETSKLKTVLVSHFTFRNMSKNSMKFFVAACKSQDINIKYKEILMMKGWTGKRVRTLRANFSLLCYAIRVNDHALFHYGVCQNLVNDYCCMSGDSAIMIAAHETHGDYYLRELLKYGANVNILDEYSSYLCFCSSDVL